MTKWKIFDELLGGKTTPGIQPYRKFILEEKVTTFRTYQTFITETLYAISTNDVFASHCSDF